MATHTTDQFRRTPSDAISPQDPPRPPGARSNIHRATWRAISPPLATLLIVGLLIQPTGWAQTDHEWEVRGKVEGWELLQTMDDGYDFDAELYLDVTFSHPELQHVRIITPGDHNWDDLGMFMQNVLVPNPKIEGRECPSHDRIRAYIRMYESDATNFVENVVLGIATGLAAAGIAVKTLGTGQIWIIGASDVGGSVIGGLAGAFYSSQQDGDRLGLANPDLDPVGKFYTIRDPKTQKGAKVFAVDYSYETSGTTLECSGGNESTRTIAIPADATADIFDPLESALASIPSVDREPGVFRLTDHAMNALRHEAELAVLGVGELAAANAVGGCSGFAGCSAALSALLDARTEASSGNTSASLAAYRQSFSKGYTSWYDAVPDSPISFPKGMVLTRHYFLSQPGDSVEFGVWAQGLDPGETIDWVSIDNQPGDVAFDSFPGNHRRVVSLFGDLGAEFLSGELLGTARVSGGRIDPPDAGCDEDHLVDASGFNQGVYIDNDVGPYLEPDPGGCGYGPVSAVQLPIPGGGVAPGAAAASPAYHTISMQLDDSMATGSYDMVVTVRVSGSGGSREHSAPLILVVPKVHPGSTLFADDFETGTTGAW